MPCSDRIYKGRSSGVQLYSPLVLSLQWWDQNVFFYNLQIFFSGGNYSAADVKSSQAPADGYVLQPLELRRRLWLHELINRVYEITFAANTHTHKRKGKRKFGTAGSKRRERRVPNTQWIIMSLPNLVYWTGVTKLFSLFLGSTTELLSVILTPSASGTRPQVRFIKNSKDFSSQL